jgi:serine/threonine-protein kinase RsbW
MLDSTKFPISSPRHLPRFERLGRDRSAPDAVPVNVREPLRVTVDARPENVPVVRHAIVGVAEVVGLSPAQTKDVEIAVTEACTNAVLHAYGSSHGVIEVAAWVGERQLVITVRDRGRGISAPPDHHNGLGLGIPLMEGLADQLNIREPDDGGTEVRLTFLSEPDTPSA